MTELLYLKDCYMKEFDARVEDVLKEGVVLNRTAFYPEGGGQPSDEGRLTDADGNEYVVYAVKRIHGKVVHELGEHGLIRGMSVHGVLNWERRYRLMRMHTASHVLSGVIYKETGALITGNQLGLERSRVDFSLKEFDRERIKEFERRANEIVDQGIEVRIRELPREEAFKLPSLFRLKNVLPKFVERVRFTDLGFDQMACGGTHVRNTREIGRIVVLKAENKGKENRRIYFTVE
jgi:misacylated tRNA(Ala) deacylase